MTLRNIPLTVPEQIADIYEQLRKRKPLPSGPPQSNLLVELEGQAVGTAQIVNLLQGSGIIIGATASGGQVNITLSATGGTSDHNHMGTGADSTVLYGLDDAGPALANADSSIAGGPYAIANGVRSIAIGAGTATEDGASTGGIGCIAIGASGAPGSGDAGAIAEADDSIAIGRLSRSADGAVSLGNQARARALSAIAIGPSAYALEGVLGDDGQLAVGLNARAEGNRNTAVGWNANALADYAAAFGTQAVANDLGGTAVGFGANTTGIGATAIGGGDGVGNGAVANGVDAIAIGTGSAALADGTLAVGSAGLATALNATSIGTGSTAGHANSTALGVLATTTAINQIMLGTSTEEVYFPGTAPLWIPQGASAGYVLTSDAAGHASWGAGGGGGGVTGFATPNLTLGTANAAGAATTVIRSDATILVFDSTNPVTQAFGDAASPGSGTIAAYRNHKHAMPAAAITTSGLTQATGKLLGRSTAATGAIEEITLGTNLSFSGTTLNASGGGTSPLTTKGDVWGFSTVDARIPIGTNGQVLTADSAQTLGLKWAAAASGSVATDIIWDAKGDLAVGTGADTAAKLTRGTDGFSLHARANDTDGLAWGHSFTQFDLAPGASVDSRNEEMTSTSFVNTWTWLATSGTPTNQSLGDWVSATNAAPSWNINTDVPGALVMQPLAGQGLYAYMTFAPGSGNKAAVIMKARLCNSSGTDDLIRLNLYKEVPAAISPNDGVITEVHRTTNNADGRSLRRNGSTSSNIITSGTNSTTLYLALVQLTSNHIITLISTDGLGWLRTDDITGLNINANVNYLGIVVNDTSNSGTPCIAVIEYIRFLSASTNLWLMGAGL